MRYFRTCALLGLACLLLALSVRAVELPEELEHALPREAETLLEDVSEWNTDSFTEGLCSIWAHLKDDAGALLRRQTRSAARIFMAAVLCGFARGFQRSTGEENRFLTMTGALTVTLLTAGSLDTLMGAGVESVRQMNTFSKALLPTLAAVSALSGGAAGTALRQIATVFFVDLLLGLVSALLSPMICLYIAVLAAGSSLGDRRLTALAETIKTICVRILTIVLLAFTLYLTVSGIFAGTVDGASVRVAKSAISGMIPVVGGIIAEASETVLAGASVMKGAIGVFGLLGVLALCAYPFLRIGIQYLLYKFTALLISVIGDAELCGLINGLGGAFGLLLGMVGSCALGLLISILASVAVVTA